jgi:hypothetical protein
MSGENRDRIHVNCALSINSTDRRARSTGRRVTVSVSWRPRLSLTLQLAGSRTHYIGDTLLFAPAYWITHGNAKFFAPALLPSRMTA